jgi:hypothetical protein
MNQEQRTHLEEIQRLLIRRLQALQRHAAARGFNTEPAITTEIEDIQGRIAEIQQRLSVPEIDKTSRSVVINIEIADVQKTQQVLIDAAIRAFLAVINTKEEVADSNNVTVWYGETLKPPRLQIEPVLSRYADDLWVAMTDRRREAVLLSLTQNEQRALYNRLNSREQERFREFLSPGEMHILLTEVEYTEFDPETFE